MTNEEKAMWLNRCMEAGLTVVGRHVAYDENKGGWIVYDYTVHAVNVGSWDFLVLEPHETIDNFSLPEGWV